MTTIRIAIRVADQARNVNCLIFWRPIIYPSNEPILTVRIIYIRCYVKHERSDYHGEFSPPGNHHGYAKDMPSDAAPVQSSYSRKTKPLIPLGAAGVTIWSNDRRVFRQKWWVIFFFIDTAYKPLSRLSYRAS